MMSDVRSRLICLADFNDHARCERPDLDDAYKAITFGETTNTQ